MDISGLSSDLLGQYSSIYNNSSTELDSALNVDKDATDEELMSACKQFEQYFVEQVIKEMKNTLPEDSLMGDSEYASMYEDEYVKTMAEAVTDSGQIGFAQQLYESMSAQSKAISIEELNAADNATSAQAVSAASNQLEQASNIE